MYLRRRARDPAGATDWSPQQQQQQQQYNSPRMDTHLWPGRSKKRALDTARPCYSSSEGTTTLQQQRLEATYATATMTKPIAKSDSSDAKLSALMFLSRPKQASE